MIPSSVSFTDLVVDPLSLIQPRCHKGVIPPSWTRYRYSLKDVSYPSLNGNMNKWLEKNIEGRWSLLWYYKAYPSNIYDESIGLYVTIAFEKETDAVTFVLMNGPRESLKRTV